MERGTKKIFLFSFLVFFLLTLVSAKIEINNQYEKYNLGDTAFLEISLLPSTISGTFGIDLVCGNDSINLYKISPADGSFSAGQQQKVNHRVIFTKEFIGNLLGECYFTSYLGQESTKTNTFLLTNLVDVSFNAENKYEPSQNINLEIVATKANGKPLQGFAEITLKNITQKIEIKDGKGNFVQSFTDDEQAGFYSAQVFVYDAEGLNRGNGIFNYEILQVPKKLEIVLPSASAINPGENYEFAVDIFDQSNQKISDEVVVSYTSPSNKKQNLVVKTGEINNLTFSTNAEAGKYILSANYKSLQDTKEFELNAKAILDYNFVNGTSLVSITNIGNADFDGEIYFDLGNGKNISLNTEIKKGEEKRLNLKAPDGNYDVKISSENSEEKTFSQIPLTGNAISFERESLIPFATWGNLFRLLIIILVVVSLAIFVKYKKRTTRFKEEKIKQKPQPLEEVSARVFAKKQFLDLTKPLISEAESDLSVKGKKENCTIVSIYQDRIMGPVATTRLNEIISEEKGKGIVDSRGTHLLVIFSPTVTKSVENELNAIQFALNITKKIEDSNKRFSDKIKCSIAINSGDIVSSFENGKMKYLSLGNAVLLAKRMSDLKKEKILVTGDIRRKFLRELKATRIEHYLGDVDIYEIYFLADRTPNQQKLKDLLKRTSFG